VAIEAVQKLEGEARTSMLAHVLVQLREADKLALSVSGQPGLFDQMEQAAINSTKVAIPAVKSRRRRKRAKPK
jgi:hypothetical protein